MMASTTSATTSSVGACGPAIAIAIGFAWFAGVVILHAAIPRIAAAVSPRGTNSAAECASPRFPGWVTRTWLPALQAMAFVAFASAFSPTWGLFLWSFAGPWTVVAFGAEASIAVAVVVTMLLLSGVAAYSIRPNVYTAMVCLICGACWFALGFGTVKAGV
jgi:hypothetical protein